MKKYTKSFVEIFCNTNASHCEEVQERNPSMIKNDGYIHGFRFFDISYIEDDGLLYESQRHNYSKNIYFGEKYNVTEFLDRFPTLRNIIHLKRENASYCVFNTGDFILMDDDDMMYHELIEKNKTI